MCKGWLIAACAAPLLLAGTARAQVRAAAAEERFDVDGDGKLDVVRVSDLAQLEVLITGKPAQANPWKALQGDGKLIDARISWGKGKRFGGNTVIVAEAGFRQGRGAAVSREALAVRWDKGALVELWRGPVGAIGRDGEWSVQVEATAFGLLRYNSAPGVTRCDGQPAYMAAERWDFSRGAFRAAAQPVRVADDAPVVTATGTPPERARAITAGIAFRAEAASTLLVPPREIDDGDPRTAWVEDRSGFGRGEFITLRSGLGPQQVEVIRIVPGHAASASAFSDHNRVKRLGLALGGRAFWIDIPVDPAETGAAPDSAYWAVLPEPVSADCATVVIADVHPRRTARRNAGDTAIAELSLLTTLDLSPLGAEASLAEMIARGDPHETTAARMLSARGQTATQALIDQANRSRSDEPAMLRIRRALASVPAGAEELARGLREDSLSRGDQELFSRALAAMGKPSIAPVAQLASDRGASATARERAIHVLGAIATPDALAPLVDAAGDGSRSLRRELAEAIAGRDVAELPLVVARAQEAQSTPPREADLWRAVGLMARRAPAGAERAAAARAIAARLENATSYELRYRLLDAAGKLDEPAAIDAVAAALDASRSGDGDSEAVALRRVAVAALDGNRSSAVIAPLVACFGDRDPGVRERAVAALARQVSGDDALDRALIARLDSDRWAIVRRAAAAGLGARCDRGAPRAALLAASKRETEDADVRRNALSGLVQCRAEGIGSLLIAIAAGRAQPFDVRTHALRLVGQLGDRAMAPALIEQFTALRKRAWSNEESARLAATAAGAMCKLGDRAAIAPLTDAARDSTFPDVQAAALVALGCFCPPGIDRLARELVESDQRHVSLAARGIVDRCRPR